MKARLLTFPLLAHILVACGDSVQPPSSEQSAAQERALTPPPERAPQSTQGAKAQDRSYTVQLCAGASLHAVFETSKREEIVLLELSSDKVAFTALISRRKYEEVMALTPPAYFVHDGLEYVKNELFFWGASGEAEEVSVDGKLFPGFILDADSSQVVSEEAQVGDILEALAVGDKLRLEKHYWSDATVKDYPVFVVSAFREGLSRLKPSAGSAFTVRDSETRCKSHGARKIVWLDNPEGVFALNGHAIELVQGGSRDVPWQPRGRPVYIGRDTLGVNVTHSLIAAGLKRCR